MLVLREPSLWATLFGFFLVWTTAQASSSNGPTIAVTSQYSAFSVCPSRTINYITETLPQQCLRSSWSSNATTPESQSQSNGVFTTVDGEAHETGLQASTQTQPKEVHSSSRSSTSSSSQPETGSAEVAESATTVQPTASSSADPAVKTKEDEDTEQDADPLSDNASFLSFEEWKAQMLKDAGQSPEHVAGIRKAERGSEARRRPSDNHDLDSLGDDAEISIDFTGFVSPDSVPDPLVPANLDNVAKKQKQKHEPAEVAEDSFKRSQEAGTTSKQRFNYASFDCAATVLKTNDGCKGPNSILVENKDTYMLNKCSIDNRFLIVELCNDILIDTIALSNYEFFSSTFRTFRVSISDRYPVKSDKWRVLGTFEAQNTRGVQAFSIANGLIWARYLRIEFMTHYGNEYYCPVSLLRVHGKTMMDDYRNEVKNARGDDDIDEEVVVSPEDSTSTNQENPATDSFAETSDSDESESETGESATSSGAAAKTSASIDPDHRMPSSFNDTCPRTNYLSPLIEQVMLITSDCNGTTRFCNQELTRAINASNRKIPLYSSYAKKNVVESPGLANSNPETTTYQHDKLNQNSTKTNPAASKSNHVSSRLNRTETTQQHATDTHGASNSTSIPKQGNTTQSANSSSSSHTQSEGSSGNQSPSRSATQPPSPAPSTQESFFKSVHKRLQLLEANSTLSLQYIEEQSRILREAFTKVEKRQLSKTTTFLESLNVTVLSELREFRLQYDQIWQSTILELSSQREQSHREAIALSSRLTILADEVLWQKRLVYLQFGLILICLGLIVLSRNPFGVAGGSPSSYLELPLLQNMMSRSSPNLLRRYHHSIRGLTDESPPDTPMSRPISRYGQFNGTPRHISHTRSTSEDTTKSPNSDYQPPTPPSEEDSNGHLSVQSAAMMVHGGGSNVNNSPEQADMILRRTMSTPNMVQEGLAVDGHTPLSDDEEDDEEQVEVEEEAEHVHEINLENVKTPEKPHERRTVRIEVDEGTQ